MEKLIKDYNNCPQLVEDYMNCSDCPYNNGIYDYNYPDHPCGRQNCWYSCTVCKYNNNGGCWWLDDEEDDYKEDECCDDLSDEIYSEYSDNNVIK